MDQFRLRKSSVKSTQLEAESSPSFLKRRQKTDKSASDSLGSSPVSPSHISVKGRVTRNSDSNNSNSNPEIHLGSVRSSDSGAGGHPLNVSDWNEKVVSDPVPTAPKLLPKRNIDPPCPPRTGSEWVWFPEGYWAEREIAVAKTRTQSQVQKWFGKKSRRQSGSASPKITGKRKKVPSTIYNEAAATSKISSKNSTLPSSIKNEEGKSDRSSPAKSSMAGGNPTSDTSSKSGGDSRIRRGFRFMSNLHPHIPASVGEHGKWYAKTKKGFNAVRKGKLVCLQDYGTCKTGEDEELMITAEHH